MIPSVARKSLILLPALLFGLAIVVASVSPVNRIALGTRAQSAASSSIVHHAAVLHIMVHILIFSVAACVAWFAALFGSEGFTGRMLAVVVTLLLGCTTEYLQHAVHNNPIEVSDVYANVLSSTIVFIVLAVIENIRKRKLKPLDDTAFILRDLD